MSDEPAPAPVAVVGAGSIGVAFAVLFATAGRPVRVHDPLRNALSRAGADLEIRLDLLAAHGLLDRDASEVASLVTFEPEVVTAVAGAALVQECAPEQLDLKRDLFTAIAAHTPADSVLASSSSAIVPSAIAAGLPADVTERLLVAHPGNPPYLLPVIELVPSPATAPATVDRAAALYRAAGMRPVRVRREVEGFVFNRLQGALLREAYCLVRDGVASVDDIDEVVRSGLGRRWSLIGPFETADLNTRGGVESHVAKMGQAYERMGAERGQHDAWTPELVATVAAERRALLDLDDWEDRVRWRDEQLMRLKAVWDEKNWPA